VTLTNKISLSGEPSLAVSAGIRLGMCPRVSCTHTQSYHSTENLTDTNPKMTKLRAHYENIIETHTQPYTTLSKTNRKVYLYIKYKSN